VDRLDPHLIARAADVDVFDELQHAADVGGGIGDDEQVAGGVDRDVGVLALELRQDGVDFVGRDVAEAVEARNVPVVGRNRLARGVERRRLRGDAGRLDDLEELAVGNDGEPVGLEHGEERLVRLGDGDLLLLGRVDVDLDVAHLAAIDEALARDRADRGDELGEIAFLDREVDEPLRGLGELRVRLDFGERHRSRRLGRVAGRRAGGRCGACRRRGGGRSGRGAWRGRGRRRCGRRGQLRGRRNHGPSRVAARPCGRLVLGRDVVQNRNQGDRGQRERSEERSFQSHPLGLVGLAGGAFRGCAPTAPVSTVFALSAPWALPESEPTARPAIVTTTKLKRATHATEIPTSLPVTTSDCFKIDGSSFMGGFLAA
jgi:hypothetical protein